jgi:M3 family oligoendopeptidase
MPAPSPELRSARRFADITASPPHFEEVQAEYDEIGSALDTANGIEEATQAFARWDALRRAFATWSSLTELQFQRYTTNPEYKTAVDLHNALRPKITGLDVAMKRRFLAHPLRAELERRLGEYVFARWETDVTAYDPVIEPFAVQESTLTDEYTALIASAKVGFRGEQLNLAVLGKYAEDPDRETRRDAQIAKWSFFAQHGDEIDRIFDKLVHVRTEMAREMDFHNFTELAYRRLTRTDYGPAEVARWREEIVREIVPLAQRIVERQAKELGIDRVMLWDEKVYSRAGAPKPPQRYDDMLGCARDAFNAMNPSLGSFARMMMERELIDLQSRDGKANAGFCTSFPAYGLPYVFANFNGSTHDVNVLLHEFGHAFQCYQSREIPISDCLWPTFEACEIHSMSMEFFTWPQLERFFGDEAQRYRLEHLQSSLTVLPYAAAIDHFQHLVYEHPEATPEERHGFWRQLEATYMPWRSYDGLEYPERGAFWQHQRHVFIVPFYYIDYTLAMCCALQFWARSLDDYDRALKDYIDLCKRGGTMPFQSLVRSAGLQSPFEPGVLHNVTQRAANMIGATSSW